MRSSESKGIYDLESTEEKSYYNFSGTGLPVMSIGLRRLRNAVIVSSLVGLQRQAYPYPFKSS